MATLVLQIADESLVQKVKRAICFLFYKRQRHIAT